MSDQQTPETVQPDARPFALVTGASSGIGLELARQLAGHGHDLLVTAEDAAIEGVAGELRALGADVTTFVADLRTGEGVEALYAATVARGRTLAVAALNAGIGRGGAFVDNSLDDELDVIRLNVLGTVHLAKLVLDDMVLANAGRILVTSSIASEMPGPFQSTYNASKSFLQSFTQALQAELAETEVTLTALMPGPTDTPFWERAGVEDTALGQGPMDDPAEVARQGFDALMAGKAKVAASSPMTKATAAAAAVIPDKVKALLHRVAAKPRGEDADQAGGATGSGGAVD
ncbi:Short-chain dehydrogenase [Microlunatus sagamiharensis]|uniref:Short-chain dehydrogenase n=1 Tax=Microlunatus sagamiharensis TaxID=546874 RepID=A0A1H2MUZ0_9ACTN|nr:SDR family NAD(P)-dependent oxidoreductase [Microlunatus sagamiharensis]SDU97103.1 Short-chain dehydrogenase [Microlunatus sagamiharensis]